MENKQKIQYEKEQWKNFVCKSNFCFNTNFIPAFMLQQNISDTFTPIVSFHINIRKKITSYAIVNSYFLHFLPANIFWEFCLRDFGTGLSTLPNSAWPDAYQNICQLRLALYLLQPQQPYAIAL